MTEYKVVPFVASVKNLEGAQQAAMQLEALILQAAAEGWQYMGLESVETFVAGTGGCFGIGAQPGRLTSYSMAVFQR
jgi:hypothetical protein